MQLKEPIPANIYSVAEKQLFQQVMSFPSTEYLRVLPFAILNLPLEIKVHIQDAQGPMPPLSDIRMMEAGLELDYHRVQEKLFQVFAEPQLVL